MTKDLIDNARRAASYIKANPTTTVAEDTAANLLSALARRVEELQLAIEPILDEMSLWNDAKPSDGILAIGPVSHGAGVERLTIGDLRHMRTIYHGGPEAEREARIDSFIEMNGQPEEGDLDDLIYDVHEKNASAINNSGPQEQMRALGYTEKDVAGWSQEDLDSMVIRLMDQVASESCNGCIRTQIRTLFDNGIREADIIDAMTPEAESAMRP